MCTEEINPSKGEAEALKKRPECQAELGQFSTLIVTLGCSAVES
jgi:hypothetical protein